MLTSSTSSLPLPALSGADGITLPPAVCAQKELISELEWLLVDGRSGYATGSVDLNPGRRYHGLLVLPLPPENKRYVLLGHLEERVSAGSRSYALSDVDCADNGSSAREPRAQQAELERFALMPCPTWVYRLATDDGDLLLCRELLMDGLDQQLLMRWTLSRAPGQPEVGSNESVDLELAPYLPFREADDLTFYNDVLNGRTRLSQRSTWQLCRKILPYASLPELSMAWQGAGVRWREDPHWMRGIVHRIDLERGYGGHEDRFSPGNARLQLKVGEQILFAAGIKPATKERPEDCWRRVYAQAQLRWKEASADRSPGAALLWQGADDFLARSPLAQTKSGGPSSRLGILAGFPWFGEWGRDVFLSLPGLTLARGNLSLCAEVLQGALPFLRAGLLPNIYAATPETSHYGSVDASLWFARAARLYRQAGGDQSFCRGPLRAALGQIRESYVSGTTLGIRGDEDGLVQAGGPDLNPTWMDAQTSNGPVTPRAGCPVEIAALWILLLSELAELEPDKDKHSELTDALRLAKETFRRRFWMESEGLLADLWTTTGTDCALRPNAVLAAAMDTTPLSLPERERLLQHVDRELLTPAGLRTLTPKNPSYRARYRGGSEERDSAYHQGTVWPWLLGTYVELCLMTRGKKKQELQRLRSLLIGLERELLRAGLGHVSEVFDGDEPQEPGGTMAQAWNTAELLRARALLKKAEESR